MPRFRLRPDPAFSRSSAPADLHPRSFPFIIAAQHLDHFVVDGAGAAKIEQLSLQAVGAGSDAVPLGDVTGHGKVGGGIIGDMHLLALGDQGIPVQRMGVVAAGKGAQPADIRLPDPESAAVAPGPDHFFRKGGHEFAVLAENLSGIVDDGDPNGSSMDNRAQTSRETR